MAALVDSIRYKDGYKHVLFETYEIDTGIIPVQAIKTDLIDLSETGHLTVRKNFPWDGASGPTWDNRKVKRASLVHDALYWLMRLGYLHDQRKEVDKLFYEILLVDGLWKPRAWVWYKAVRAFSKYSSTRQGERKVKVAP